MISLTWPQVFAFRLSRHHLLKRAPRKQLTKVIGDVCGIHAQLMSAAELSIWARVEGLTPDEIRSALWERKKLVKTWCMRGTLHLLPVSEFPTYVTALRARRNYTTGAWLRYFGMNLDELTSLYDTVRTILDGQTLTRESLAVGIGRQLGPKLRKKLLSGWGSLLKPAAYQGNLIFGPSQGQNVTFVRPDQWLGITLDDLDSDEALKRIAGRFLAAYGPATHVDFARWWGGGTEKGTARRVFRALGSEITEVSVEGEPAWVLVKDASRLQKMKPAETVRLLPNFDVYTLNFMPRQHLVPARFAARIFRPQGWISPVILINGIAAGTWALNRTGKEAEVRLQPFVPLRPTFQKRVKGEGERLGEFLGARVRISS